MTDRHTYEIGDQRLEEAADWFARMSDEAATEADWLAFTDWLEADDENRLAYAEVEELGLSLEGADVPEALREDAEDTAPQATATVIDARSRFFRPGNWVAVAAAAAAVWLAAISLGVFDPQLPPIQFYETGPGENRHVTLADGSRVHLNRGTRLEVQFSDDERRTWLKEGEALFTVASNKDRPFLVALGDRDVRVVGTVFNILRHRGQVTVTVKEGIVDVAPHDNEQRDAVRTERLTKGLQLKHREGTSETRVTEVDADAVIAWQEGFLEYEDTPLEQIIDDLNRYSPVPIRLEGTIGARPFTGILNTQNLAAAFELLANVLTLEVVESEDVIVFRAKAEEP